MIPGGVEVNKFTEISLIQRVKFGGKPYQFRFPMEYQNVHWLYIECVIFVNIFNPEKIYFRNIPGVIRHIWDKVFKSGLSKFRGRQLLKNLLSPILNTLSHIRHNTQATLGIISKFHF